MHSDTRRELTTGLQYLMMGLIAECTVIRWFAHRAIPLRLLVWFGVFLLLGLFRFLVLFLTSWFQRDRWQRISRRNWN
jgi:hypothetical protein